MSEEIAKVMTVFTSSIFKFILGPVGGFIAGLHPITTILATIGGMMTGVVIVVFLGNWLKPKIAALFVWRKKILFKRKKQLVTLWKKYGDIGIAILTPLLLTPIGGTVLLVGFGAPRNKILLYMLISGLSWSIVLTTAVYIFGKHAVSIFM